MLRRSTAFLSLIVVAAAFWAAPAVAAEHEWKSLFDGRSLDGWQEFGGETRNWVVADGLLHCKGQRGGAQIESTGDYANFELQLEYRMEKGGNSGVYLRIPDDMKPGQNPSYVGMEIQLLDELDAQYAHIRPAQYTGSVYDVAAAKREFVKPAGEWGKIDIVCDRRHVQVTLNGTKIVDANLDDYPQNYKAHPGIRPEAKTGHVGLQYHTGPLDFRNIRIRELP
jgi:hypothetical protein